MRLEALYRPRQANLDIRSQLPTEDSELCLADYAPGFFQFRGPAANDVSINKDVYQHASETFPISSSTVCVQQRPGKTASLSLVQPWIACWYIKEAMLVALTAIHPPLLSYSSPHLTPSALPI